MPAPRKPATVLELTGAWRKDPNRRRVQPPALGAIGNAPKQSPLTFAQAWRYISKCCPEGVLRDRDRVYLEIAVSLFVQFRQAPAVFHPAKLARLEMMLSKLGMSPADATRVRAEAPAKRREFDDF